MAPTGEATWRTRSCHLHHLSQPVMRKHPIVNETNKQRMDALETKLTDIATSKWSLRTFPAEGGLQFGGGAPIRERCSIYLASKKNGGLPFGGGFIWVGPQFGSSV